MAKAWMPFYIADYLADTGHLTTEQHGAFVLSLFHYWQSNQPLPANAVQLQMICRCMDAAKFVQIWDVVSMFYIREGDSWRNNRMDKELAKAHQLSQTRAKAAKVRYEKTPAKEPANAVQLHTQSQSQSPKPVTNKPCSSNDDELQAFDIFWDSFDYKKGKVGALKSWNKIKFTQSLIQKIIDGAKVEAKNRPVLIEKGMTPKMAQGWLTEKRWEDEHIELGSGVKEDPQLKMLRKLHGGDNGQPMAEETDTGRIVEVAAGSHTVLPIE